MSTRTTVTIKFQGGSIVKYYHHCDGYLTGVGETLLRFIRGGINITNFHNFFEYQNKVETGSGFEMEELDINHGDTEYKYTIYLGSPESDGYGIKEFKPARLFVCKCRGDDNVGEEIELKESDLYNLEEIDRNMIEPEILIKMYNSNE